MTQRFVFGRYVLGSLKRKNVCNVDQIDKADFESTLSRLSKIMTIDLP